MPAQKQTPCLTQFPGHDTPTLGGIQGAAEDISRHAREILKMRDRINEILAAHTGQSVDKVQKDTDRDYFMSADEAKEYGLIDEVIASGKKNKREDF